MNYNSLIVQFLTINLANMSVSSSAIDVLSALSLMKLV